MAKLRTGYLVKRGAVFYACWTVAGKKFRQSTSTGDRREAEKELARIMEPFLVEDETKTLQTIKARIEAGKERASQLHEQRNPPTTIAQTWNIFAASTERPDSGPRTLADYEACFATFRKWMEHHHPTASSLRDVSPELAAEYATHLGKRKITASTFNKAINALALVFRTLATPAKLTGNPWVAIKRRKIVSQSHRELTIDELRKVCQLATGELSLLFALGIYTGLRLVDCCTLQWGEVDLRRNIIRRVPVKMARRDPKRALVVIPLHTVLSELLAQTPSAKRSGYVLPETAAAYTRHVTQVTNKIQAHFAACGITTTRTMEGRARAVVEVGFHSLRHTFVSLCREANAPLAVVEAIVGHTSPAMTRHYTHVSELAAARAVAALPPVLGNLKTSPPTLAITSETKAAYGLPPTPAFQLRTAVQHLEGMTAKTWATRRKTALNEIRAALAWIEGRIIHESSPETSQ